MGGFGFPSARLGVGAYNRGRKAIIPREFDTEKNALWSAGLRAPIGNRIAHAAAALTYGTLPPGKPGDDVVTLGGFLPFAY